MTNRCIVTISTGKYKDEVYCDIVDIDACQLLFGRPWQFDVDAHHPGRDNTYQIKEGVKFTLLSLQRRLKPKAAPGEAKKILFTMVQSGQEIEIYFKNSKQIYALIMRQTLVAEKE